MEYWDKSRVLGNLPGDMARAMGDKEGLAFKERRWTFAELSAEIDRVAGGLMRQGIQPGEHVCLWLNNCPEWIFLMFALAKIGAVQIPVNTRFRTSDLAYILNQSNCSTLITHDTSGPIDYLAMVRELVPHRNDSGDIESADYPDLKRLIIKSEAAHPGTLNWEEFLAGAGQVAAEDIEERAAAVKAEDTLFIMYTSGTTGFPKGVMRNHSLIQNQQDRIDRMQTTDADVLLNYLPLFHIFGYVDGPLTSMMCGARQVLMETFDADQALALIESERVTQIYGFEAHYKDLIEAQQRHPHDLSSLRVGILPAGMRSTTAIVKRAATVLAPLRTITAYGMTEIGQNAAFSDIHSSDEQRCESSGYPSEGFQVRVIDPETGHDQPTGVQGELIFKTYNMMQGYYKKPEETAKAFDADGWFHSGDTGIIREDGFIRFIGRYKDMLKVGGENVDPMEVEGYLLEHPGVHEVAIVGFPDERLSEVAVAFVKPMPNYGLKSQEVIDHCKGRFASFKIPRHVLFVEEFPMTASGKVQKVKLREQAVQTLRPG